MEFKTLAKQFFDLAGARSKQDCDAGFAEAFIGLPVIAYVLGERTRDELEKSLEEAIQFELDFGDVEIESVNRLIKIASGIRNVGTHEEPVWMFPDGSVVAIDPEEDPPVMVWADSQEMLDL